MIPRSRPLDGNVNGPASDVVTSLTVQAVRGGRSVNDSALHDGLCLGQRVLGARESSASCGHTLTRCDSIQVSHARPPPNSQPRLESRRHLRRIPDVTDETDKGILAELCEAPSAFIVTSGIDCHYSSEVQSLLYRKTPVASC
jgi:hypothetical protein